MTINEMVAKRKVLLDTMDKFLESHKNENGLLSKQDDAAYADMEGQFKAMTAEIQRMQRREEMEKEMEKPVSAPLTSKPMPQTEDVKKGRASDAYKKAVLEALRSNFHRISNELQEGVDASGGYLVPEEYDRRIIEVLKEENVMRNLATEITTSGEHKINIADTAPAAAWIEEGGAIQFGDATFSQIILDAHKLHVAIKVTDELLYDSAFDLESYIIRKFGEALANSEEDAFINGDGTGKPLGFLAATGGGRRNGGICYGYHGGRDPRARVFAQASVQEERQVHVQRSDPARHPQAQGQQRRVHLATLVPRRRTRQTARLSRVHFAVFPCGRGWQGGTCVRRFQVLQHR